MGYDITGMILDCLAWVVLAAVAVALLAFLVLVGVQLAVFILPAIGLVIAGVWASQRLFCK